MRTIKHPRVVYNWKSTPFKSCGAVVPHQPFIHHSATSVITPQVKGRQHFTCSQSLFNNQQQDEDQPIVVWRDESQLIDVVGHECGNHKEAFQLLRSNYITDWKNWKGLSEDKKTEYPNRLSANLDSASSSAKQEASRFIWSNPEQALNSLLERFPREQYKSNKLVYGLGSQFPLKDREQLATDMFFETLKRFTNTSTASHKILVIRSGPGMGKSRVNMEALDMMISSGERLLDTMEEEKMKRMIRELLEMMKCGVSINVTYGDVSGVLPVDQENGSYSLGRRILHEYFAGSSMSLETFDFLLNRNWPTLPEALAIIQKHKQRTIGDGKDVFIYVGIDDYNKYSELARDQFQDLFNDVGNVMSSNLPGIFFQPLFTGMEFQSAPTITRSMYPHLYLQLSLLKFESMAQIVDAMATEHPWLKNWRGSRYFKHIMLDTGRQPRLFEYFMDECIRDSFRELEVLEKSHQNILNNIVNIVSRKYKDSFTKEIIEKFENAMIDSFLETEILQVTEDLRELQASGLIYLSRTAPNKESFKIQVPFIWIQVFVANLRYTPAISSMLDLLSLKVDHYCNFERFAVGYDILMTDLRIRRGIDTIEMQELFRGAIFQNEKMKRWKVKLQPLKFCHSYNRYKGDTGEIECREDMQVIDWQKGDFMVLNAPGSPFADAFHVRSLVEPHMKLVVLGQMKHRAAKAVTKNPKLTKALIKKEHKKSVNKLKLLPQHLKQFGDYMFVLYALHPLEADLLKSPKKLPRNTIVISPNNFAQYFGNAVATRADFIHVTSRECYPNTDSFSMLVAQLNHEKLCKTIVKERTKRQFTDFEDLVNRTTRGMKHSQRLLKSKKKNVFFFFGTEQDTEVLTDMMSRSHGLSVVAIQR